MSNRCESCGAAHSSMANFCPECGVRVPQAGAAALAGADDAHPAERRQLTVMFCDVVGSTELAEQLDAEDVHELMRAYHHTCATVIRGFGGHLAQYLGDGVLAYFGYPHAHEDAAQRAVRAGLALLDAVAALPLTITALTAPLQIRIGVHTGMTVVGESVEPGHGELLAFGGAPNVAARVQALAGPDSLVVSEATHRLVPEYFGFEPLGPYELKGVSEPVRLFRVLAETDVETRFESAVRSGLIRFVGRTNELDTLARASREVREGRGRAVVLSGEPGIGKSRLVRVLRERLGVDGWTEIDCRCSPYHQNSALYPVLDFIQFALGFEREDSPEVRLRKLRESVAPFAAGTPEAVPLLADLLSIPHGDGAPLPELSPPVRRRRTLEILMGWLIDVARRQPVFLVMEDLHWGDPSTLEFLDLLLPRIAQAPALVLLTTRQATLAERWRALEHVLPVHLSRLDRAEVETLIGDVAGERPLPPELVDQIAVKTDGVPLYVEELTKMVLESARAQPREPGRTPPALPIPATLQDSLMARLDQLPAARGVAQLAATLGREFPREWIEAVCPLDDATLKKGLDMLVDAELLLRDDDEDGATTRYTFKHALVRDAAYESLLKRKRQQFHEWTARALEQRFQDVAAAHPEVVAHHHAAAGHPELAIPHARAAGRRALGRSAFAEATHHFHHALELLQELDESPRRSALEVEIRLALGVALIATQGYGSEAVERNYSRAESLCRDLGDTPELFPAVYGLWTYHMLRDEREPALALSARLEALAARPEQRFIAASTRGVNLYWSGDFEACEQSLRHAIALYDPAYHEQLDASLGEDAALLAHLYLGWCLVERGRVRDALEALANARRCVGERASPYVRVTALVFETLTHLTLGDVEGTRERSERLIAQASEHQFPFFLAAGTCAHGWAQVNSGAPEAGIAELQQGLAVFDATGTRASRAAWLGHVAAGFLAAAKPTEGLAALQDAMPSDESRLARYMLPDLLRLQGELLLLDGADPGAAEDCLRRALDEARREGACNQALSAAARLAELLAESDRRDEAAAVLRDACAPFDDAGDGDAPVPARLRAARARLAELASDGPPGTRR